MLGSYDKCKKDEVAPNIDKVITYYIKFVRNEKRKYKLLKETSKSRKNVFI